MSNILLLRGFNNYHKRTILKYSTLEDYQDNSASFLNYSSINFNPNDGIVTELIVGNDAQLENSKILSFDDVGSPDYLVVYDIDTESNITIKSRWFILESVKTTAGQFRLALKRDVIADHMDWILNTDCFIEKAQIMDIYSPFIFNNESMTYNQIKKKEIPLYDSTGVPWIVGYVAKNYDGNSGANVTVTGKAINVENASAYEETDLPFGTITQNILNNGLTFRTINTLDLFCKIEGTKQIIPGVLGGPDIVTTAYMVGRSAIEVKDSAISTIDNNFGFYYESKNGVIQNISGPGLGNYSATSIATTNINTSAPAFSYPRASRITSAQDIMNNIMGNSFNGKSVAQNIVDELTATSLTDWSGSNIMQYDGKQVKIDDGNGGYNYYTMKVTSLGVVVDSNIAENLASGTQSSIISILNSTLNSMDDIRWSSLNKCELYISYRDYQISFTSMPATMEVSTILPSKAKRWGCNDQLFDIFCIPYGKLRIRDDVTTGGTPKYFYTNAQAGLAAARAMAQELGSNLYDLQILPYCPIKELRDACTVTTTNFYSVNVAEPPSPPVWITRPCPPRISRTSNIEIDSDDSAMVDSYQRIVDAYDSSVIYNYVFWATESHGTLDVAILSTDDCYYQYKNTLNSSVLAKKISNETEIFRLCSPNYNGLFEYSPAKNNTLPDTRWYTPPVAGDFADLHQINVDYTYRPGNPYIHLNPIFKGEDQGAIYGQDWNDIRGLICGGDFSLGYIVDAYRQYQIQNANFQNIFDRQLQNIDVNNALAKEQTEYASLMSAIGMPIAGGTTGALAGAKAGPWGAVAGAAVGGIGGLTGGMVAYNLNMEWLEKQQQETRSYAVDMYNYNLGNIKALPYSISRTDCLAENTRLVPFLEVYQATNAEVENLKKVLKYNGMTVMTVDKPINYISSSDISSHWENAIECHNKACYYIKAKLIMNTDTELPDDFHIVDAIYAELDKGVYVQGYEEE